MRFDEILDQIANQEDDVLPGFITVPPAEIIAFHVRFSRSSLQLKKEALAYMAGVSLSTIERVERADKVSDASLNKIATAFGLEPAYYTAPRTRLSRQEATTQFVERYQDMEIVAVAPLRTQAQVRELAGCHGCLVNRQQLNETFDGAIENLTEGIELCPKVGDGDIRRRV